MADLADIGARLSNLATELANIASDLQGGGGEEGPAGTALMAGGNRLGKVQLQPLAGPTVSRLRETLKNALNKELTAGGASLGLRPGDTVAISSSVGQSISF